MILRRQVAWKVQVLLELVQSKNIHCWIRILAIGWFGCFEEPGNREPDVSVSALENIDGNVFERWPLDVVSLSMKFPLKMWKFHRQDFQAYNS